MRESYTYDKRHDMRVRIFNAFRELVCGEAAISVDDVKVVGICEKAGISRRTFYNSFEDKYAIIAWFMDLTGAESFGQIGLTLNLEEGMRRLVYTVEGYRDVLAAGSASKHYGMTYSRLARLGRSGLEHAAELKLGEAVSKELRMTIRYYSTLPEAVITDWASGTLAGDAEEVSDLIVALAPESLKKLFSEPLYTTGFIPGLDLAKMPLDRADALGENPPDGTFHTWADGTYLSAH